MIITINLKRFNLKRFNLIKDKNNLKKKIRKKIKVTLDYNATYYSLKFLHTYYI